MKKCLNCSKPRSKKKFNKNMYKTTWVIYDPYGYNNINEYYVVIGHPTNLFGLGTNVSKTTVMKRFWRSDKVLSIIKLEDRPRLMKILKPRLFAIYAPNCNVINIPDSYIWI